MGMKKKIKNLLLDLLFPRFCLGCQREGTYLCQDCKSTLEISGFHQKFTGELLDDLFFALEYRGLLVKKLIHNLKYEPFVRELSVAAASLLTDHLQLLDEPPDFLCPEHSGNYIITPVPLHLKKLKWRGFNQSEEIARQLSGFLKIGFDPQLLTKRRHTLPQTALPQEERISNVRDVFTSPNPEKIREKNIILVDDVYTTGSTMREAAKVLKKNRAQKVIGMVVARGTPKQENN
ncbi:MAG: hypothetical protein GF370_04320 [Candidatus Nealsonbacteria bacterium]|nr:hypothetical protein [Candidatus Nealsonbacteria bacterium]